MEITHNISALDTGRQLGLVQRRVKESSAKLASGYRVNKAADDAAGLSISEKMREQIRGLHQAGHNLMDGVSLIQTAEGAMGEIHGILHRMEELSVQSANDTNTEDDRQKIQNEIEALKAEIDRISEETEFNTIKLLDGTFSDPEVTTSMTAFSLNGPDKGQRFTLQDLSGRSGMKFIYEDLTHQVNTVQTPTGAATLSGYGSLKQALKDQIVPQAVQGIVNRYSSTFGYLRNSSIGIGLELYTDTSSSVLASVTMGVSGPINALDVTYKLSVNMASLQFDNATGNLTAASRDELEVTIIHEMTHAMMDEALTNGMMGYTGNGQFQPGARFPMWFIEGMAQASAGGCFNGNDWVNGGLGITPSTSTAAITNILSTGNNRLSTADGGSGMAQYGTGYLACMYLGNLAGGGGAVNASKIASGLDKIMSEIKGGTSMEDALKKYTKYQSLSDFENNFANDAASFVHNLVTAVGNGSGGLVCGLATSSGFLPDRNLSVSLFELNTSSSVVSNAYPSDHPVLAGGTRAGAGSAGPGGGGGAMNIQVGANAGQLLQIYIDSMSSGAIGVGGVDVTTFEGAQDAMDCVQRAVEIVSHQRAKLGAYQNRLEHALSNVNNSAENLQAAESRIRDLDVAEEMVQYSAAQILIQAGHSMLAQANQNNNGILTLLR